MSKNEIIEILMKRDDITYSEASHLVRMAQYAIDEAVEAGDYCGAEHMMASILGLEMDYIFAFV